MTVDAGWRCAVHPERPAIVTCGRCGNYACETCTAADRAESLCRDCEEVAGLFRYHVVPVWRMIVLSVLSCGLYPNYWFYKNWKSIKAADRSDIWPVPRGVFCGFTYFEFLSDLNTYGTARDHEYERLSHVLGGGFLVAVTLSHLPDPWWLLSFAGTLFLVPAVRAIWGFASARTRERARWSTRHTVITSVLGVLWALVLLGFWMDA